MKIRFLYEDESAVVVVESEGMKDAKSLDGMEGAADSSVDAPPVVAGSDTGGAPAPADSSAPLAPGPGADSSALDDASELDSSEVTDGSEIEDASETLVDVSGQDDRLLLDTPLDSYTVTEGLLLLAVIFLALGGAIALFKGR